MILLKASVRCEEKIIIVVDTHFLSKSGFHLEVKHLNSHKYCICILKYNPLSLSKLKILIPLCDSAKLDKDNWNGMNFPLSKSLFIIYVKYFTMYFNENHTSLYILNT